MLVLRYQIDRSDASGISAHSSYHMVTKRGEAHFEVTRRNKDERGHFISFLSPLFCANGFAGSFSCNWLLGPSATGFEMRNGVLYPRSVRNNACEQEWHESSQPLAIAATPLRGDHQLDFHPPVDKVNSLQKPIVASSVGSDMILQAECAKGYREMNVRQNGAAEGHGCAVQLAILCVDRD